MRTIFLVWIPLLSNTLLLSAHAGAQSTLPVIGAMPRPDAPLPQGMVPIFDGNTLDGWVQVPTDSWNVKNGILTSLGVGRGVIYTELVRSDSRCTTRVFSTSTPILQSRWIQQKTS